MSKRIDMNKPLSDADMRYLLDRDRHGEVAFNAVVHGTELPEDVEESIRARGITAESVEKLAVAAGKLSPTEDASEHEEAGSGDVSGLGDAPEKFSDEWFDSATVAELQSELKARGMAVSGKRAELADRLYADMDEKGELPDSEENV
jgi:hypothetical protein